jgi:hypothetical protein
MPCEEGEVPTTVFEFERQLMSPGTRTTVKEPGNPNSVVERTRHILPVHNVHSKLVCKRPKGRPFRSLANKLAEV